MNTTFNVRKTMAAMILIPGLLVSADALAWHGGWHGGGHRAGWGWHHGTGWRHGWGWNHGWGWRNPGYVAVYGSRCAWIPGHRNQWGRWVPGHRNCW